MTTIDYYLTPVSPWTYLGAKRFRDIAEKHGAEVNVHVVDYGTIFPQTGGLPLPKRAPARLDYRMAELKRFRDFLGMPLNPTPDHFPSQTRLSTHAVMAATEMGGGTDGMKASEAVLAGLWADNLDMDDRGNIVKVLTAAGLDGEALVARAESQTDAYNSKIDADTQKALDQGVFGAPSYVLNGEVFWGQDRLELLDWRLNQG